MYCFCTVEFYIYLLFNSSKSFLYWLVFLVLMSFMFYVNHIEFSQCWKLLHKYIHLALYSSPIFASKGFPLHPRESHFITTVIVLPNLVPCFSSSDSFTVLSAYNLMVGAKYQTAATCWGEPGGAKLPHSLFFLTEELKEQLELDKGWQKNWLHFCTEIKGWLASEWASFCPLGHTPLPLQMLESGQDLSSTNGPGHWLSSSSLETGRPESRSKQARKRLWIETMLLPVITPACEVLCCREAEGTQGEHGVHSDHSLRMTKRR